DLRMTSEVDLYPLSPVQEGMLFHYLREPGTGVDIEQIVCTLPEQVEGNILRQAWVEVIKRHTVLRTSFCWRQESEPRQVVNGVVELPWEELDWTDVSDDAEQQRIKAFLNEDRRR